MDVLLTPSGGKQQLLLGNEAIVRGALEAGMAFATCYPGTPSSEVPDTLYRLRKQFPNKVKYYFEYSTNEKVALECASGAAASGVRTLCTMKHVGVNVAADPLMTLAYVGVNAGMVILTADDPSLFSSQNEQDNRYYARLSGLPMLEPAGPAEAKEMVAHAFELSEELGSPVFIRTTTRVNHAREAVTLGKLGKVKQKGKFVKNPMQYVTVPAVSRNLHLRLLNIYKKAMALSEASPYNKVTGRGKLGIITNGVSANYVNDALADLGAKSKIKVLKLGMSYPLPENKIASFLKSVDKVLVVEELEPIMEQAARAIAQEKGIKVNIVGKMPGQIPAKSVDIEAPAFLSRAFEYNPRLVRSAIAKCFGLKYKGTRELKLDNMPAPPGASPQPVRRLPPPGHLPRGQGGHGRGDHLRLGHRLLHPGPVTPHQGGRLPHLHGQLGLQRRGHLPGHQPEGGGLHRRQHLLPLRHHRPDQRGAQQPQLHPGDPGQRHHGHDRPSAPPRGGHRGHRRPHHPRAPGAPGAGPGRGARDRGEAPEGARHQKGGGGGGGLRGGERNHLQGAVPPVRQAGGPQEQAALPGEPG